MSSVPSSGVSPLSTPQVSPIAKSQSLPSTNLTPQEEATSRAAMAVFTLEGGCPCYTPREQIQPAPAAIASTPPSTPRQQGENENTVEKHDKISLEKRNAEKAPRSRLPLGPVPMLSFHGTLFRHHDTDHRK